MGLFDSWDSASVISRKSSSRHHTSSSHKKRKSSASLRPRSTSPGRSRSRSPGLASSFFGAGGDDKHNHHHSRHNSSRASFFGLPNASTRSFFGTDKHRSSTSRYGRSPRPNFFTRAYKQLRRLLRDLVYYAKRHPLKVFTLVVLPLITGGALTALLARFGLRLPPGLEGMLGMGARAMSGGTVGLVGEAVRMASGSGHGAGSARVERGRDGGLQWERRSWERDMGGGGWGEGMMEKVRDWF